MKPGQRCCAQPSGPEPGRPPQFGAAGDSTVRPVRTTRLRMKSARATSACRARPGRSSRWPARRATAAASRKPVRSGPRWPATRAPRTPCASRRATGCAPAWLGPFVRRKAARKDGLASSKSGLSKSLAGCPYAISRSVSERPRQASPSLIRRLARIGPLPWHTRQRSSCRARCWICAGVIQNANAPAFLALSLPPGPGTPAGVPAAATPTSGRPAACAGPESTRSA